MVHLPYEAECDDTYNDNFTNSTTTDPITNSFIKKVHRITYIPDFRSLILNLIIPMNIPQVPLATSSIAIATSSIAIATSSIAIAIAIAIILFITWIHMCSYKLRRIA